MTAMRRHPRRRRAPARPVLPGRPGRGIGAFVVAVVAVVAVVTFAACSPGTGQEVRSDRAVEPTGAGQARLVAGSLWSFTADLHRALVRRDPQANRVVAPVPVALALTQARAGAFGTTRDQLTSALHAGEGYDDGIASVWQELPRRSGPRTDAATGRQGDVSIALVSSLWGQRNTRFAGSWLATLATTWDQGIRVTDFRSDPESARRTVNEWMASSTDGYITELLPRGSIDELTRFLATGAAYLRAPWALPFDRTDTRLVPFTRLDGSEVTVPLMRRVEDGRARTATGDGWQAVELPYLGDELRITFVVPDEGRFEEVEGRLDGASIERLLASLRRGPVDVAIPQFGVTTDVRLDDALRALGVIDAFDRSVADFSDITTDEPLSLAGVAHQTFLAVDEEGTEASGSAPRTTTTTTARTTLVSPPDARGAPNPAAGLTPSGETRASIVVDRPFLVIVADRATGAPVLYGRVLAPRG
jgi:serpin B